MPKAETQDMASAASWYRSQMDRLAQMVDKTAPFGAQLKQAEKPQGLLLGAAAHSLGDPAMAGSFRVAFLRPGVEGLTQRLGGADRLSGAVLQQKTPGELTAPVDKARRWFEPGACFAAGTLVHTQEGLKPIEQIKVGDWVLSRPENPEHGTQTDYKRVVRTMVHHDKPVIYGSFNYTEQHSQYQPYPKGRRNEPIIMTPDHPFWLKDVGWTAAASLREELLDARLFENLEVTLRFIDCRGEELLGSYKRQVLITNDPTVGWVRGISPLRPDCGGWTFNMTTGQSLPDADWDKFWDYQDENPNPPEWDFRLDDPIDSKNIYKATVYNIEVEDWHTYFVGELGVWVHNANCDGLQVVQNAKNFDQALPRNTLKKPLLRPICSRRLPSPTDS